MELRINRVQINRSRPVILHSLRMANSSVRIDVCSICRLAFPPPPHANVSLRKNKRLLETNSLNLKRPLHSSDFWLLIGSKRETRVPSLILACCLRAHVKPLMFQYRFHKTQSLTQLSLFPFSLFPFFRLMLME